MRGLIPKTASGTVAWQRGGGELVGDKDVHSASLHAWWQTRKRGRLLFNPA
jgi:hypothetical protein